MLWGFSLQAWQIVVFWLWVIAAGAGALAVAASFGSSVVSYFISEETQRGADKQIAEANKVAGQANARAAALELRAAELNESASKANERALKAQTDLEKYKAPRSISNEAATQIVLSLNKFSGRTVSVGGSPLTFESASLAEQIVSVLKAAGIKADINEGAASAQVGLANGVVARYVTGNSIGEEIAVSITTELTKIGIATIAIDGMMEDLISKNEQQFPRDSEYHRWVVIAVGDKK